MILRSRKVSDQSDKKISEHYAYMSEFVEQLRTTAMSVGDLRKKADKKGLEVVESNLQDAIYSLLAAYATINPIFTGTKIPKEKE